MRVTFPLGHWCGVVVGAHWSVGVTTALVADLLAEWILPPAAPGYPVLVYWAVGLVSAGVFVLSLLAHELSHAIVARRKGVQVRRITLWMLGGATELDGEAGTPKAELVIAGVGPLTSLLTAVLFAAGTELGVAAGLPRPVLGGLFWLALANGALAVFNALPGAPLDGGRMLRAALWKHYGDKDRAGAAAGRVGQLLGVTLVVAGMVEILALNEIVGGLWLTVIGWFLTGSAAVEAGSHRLRGELAHVLVRDAMHADPVCAPSWWTVDTFLDHTASEHRERVFPVVDFLGVPIGVVSLTDLSRVPPEARLSTRVADAYRPMSPDSIAAPGDALGAVAFRGRLRPGEDLVLVLDAGHLVGVLGVEDVTRAVQLTKLGNAPRAAVSPQESC